MRVPWKDFPDVIVHTNGAKLKSHPDYSLAKAGDFDAAARLSADLIKPEKIPAGVDYIVPVNQLDRDRQNMIPVAAALHIFKLTRIPVILSISQTVQVHHTGADARSRIVEQPTFRGTVPRGNALIIDDVVTFGSTLANLRGFIENSGGKVAAAMSLAPGGFGSTKLNPRPIFYEHITKSFGQDLQKLGQKIGFTPDCFTQSETLFLSNLKTIDRVRSCFAEELGLSRSSQVPRLRL